MLIRLQFECGWLQSILTYLFVEVEEVFARFRY